MKIGARNAVIGEVIEVKKDGLMCHVKVKVPEHQAASVMTAESVEEMGLKKGDRVHVIAKAVNVLLIKE